MRLWYLKHEGTLQKLQKRLGRVGIVGVGRKETKKICNGDWLFQGIDQFLVGLGPAELERGSFCKMFWEM